MYKRQEVNLFLRGLIPTMGFQSDIVYFDVKKREAGRSKYTLKKMVALATNGVTSMSTRPIQFITILGFLAVSYTHLDVYKRQAQGSAVHDTLHAARIVIGTESRHAEKMLQEIYEPFKLPVCLLYTSSSVRATGHGGLQLIKYV